jgi:hypothetical protein
VAIVKLSDCFNPFSSIRHCLALDTTEAVQQEYVEGRNKTSPKDD